MKQQFKFRWYNYLLLLTMVMFVGVGTNYAQTGQNNRKAQRFAQCDRNGDGFIGKGECQNAHMSNFDQNGDGVLSRKEYRKMKHSQNKAMKGAGNGQRLRDGSGNGQGQGYRRNTKQPNTQGTNRNKRSGRDNGRRGG